MTSRVRLSDVLCFALLAAGLSRAVPARASIPQPDRADEVYTSINAQRAASGLAPLARLRTAELAAQLHAMDMANREYMSHYTLASATPVVPDPIGYPAISFTGGMTPGGRLAASGYSASYYGWGENVAYNWGYGTQSAQVAVNGWMNSSGHRANILNPSYLGTGVGCAQSATGRIYYGQVFVYIVAGHPMITSNVDLGVGGSSSPPPPPPVTDTTAPAGWASFSPATTQTLAPNCTVSVSDSGRGLDVATAKYRYSRSGGAWSGWLTASCTGSAGTTTPQQITASSVPFNVVSSQHQVQFQIADLAGNVGTSSSYTVNVQAASPAPPPPASDLTSPGYSPGYWSGFAPGSTTDQTPDCAINVLDAGSSGLNVATAEYRYSRDGGVSWSAWTPASCTGVNGSTTQQQITASNVPFNQVSSTRNRIRFRVKDMAGNTGVSNTYTVNVLP